MRLKTACILMFFLLLVGGCSWTARPALERLEHLALPPQQEIGGVPFFPQEQYQCGPAVLAMALTWSGVATTPEKLAPEVFTAARKGSLQADIIGGVRRNGRVAYPIAGMAQLVEELAAGHPVIVLQNLGLSWIPVWHYSLAFGYDLKAETILLHSGKFPRKRTSFKVFERTWARSDHWGLLVLPPGMLPRTADEIDYLSAVAGLERTAHRQEALTAYKAALDRWPASYAAHIAVGNCYYGLGELKAAEKAYRETAAHFPERGAAYNNLAQVLLEQDRCDEALAAIKRAMAIDGPAVKAYRQTLGEIEARMRGR